MARPRVVRRLAWLALGAVAAVPIVDSLVRVALPTAPRDAATLLRAVGLFAGAAGVGLLTVVIVLGLRSPILERTLGPLDRLIRLHHALGVAAYVAILIHPLALAAALAASSSSWSTSARMLFGLDRPSIALGWLAVAALVLVVISSFTGHPSHETWRRIHLFGWLAGALGVVHAVAIRGLHASDVVLAGVLLAAVTEKSVGLALYSARYRVDRVRRLAPALLEVELVPLRRSLRFCPGQFAFVRFHDPQTGFRCREYHPFTIASGLLDAHLRLTIKQLGDCTRRLLDVQEGALADVRGPFGSLFAEVSPGRRRQIWLAGGIGIAPFLSAARSLGCEAPSIDLFYCTKRASDAVYLTELEGLTREQPSLRLHPHVDETHGLLTAEHVLSEAGDTHDAEFFIAGPPAFSTALREDLIAHHVAARRIHSERFEHL